MKSFLNRAFARALAGAALLAIAANPAHASANDYEFELVSKDLKAGQAEIAVRLVHKPDRKPVADAVIFTTRLDMAPDGMAQMTTPVTLMPGSEPGVYRFSANLTMAGGWAFSLAAKVQGEAETVQGKLILNAQ